MLQGVQIGEKPVGLNLLQGFGDLGSMAIRKQQLIHAGATDNAQLLLGILPEGLQKLRRRAIDCGALYLETGSGG